MEIPGHIQNGVVVFDENPRLTDGTAVTVMIPACVPPATPAMPEKEEISRILEGSDSASEGVRIRLPLVRTGEPGTLHLTNEKIREVFEDEEIEALRAQWNVPS